MSLRVSAVAREAADRTAAYYDTRPGRYGTAFLDEFAAAVAAVAASPRLYPPCEDARDGYEDREFFIARFQQRMIYTVTADEVVILTVIHASARPAGWHRRIDPAT